MKKIFIIILYIHIFSNYSLAQGIIIPSTQGEDLRFKADILLVLAHPDDETAIGSYLAKVIFDQKKKVAAVYSNRGNGGGNSLGNEQSTTLGLIRETEVRSALSSFGVTNVWFLDGKDTPGQDVFHSLQNLNHGAALEKLVRIIRLTKPEVILTWLPNYVSGENHGDHQASGVLATEAFDLAGDPTIFPAHVAFPRESRDINNFNEGLDPWQPKKIYYFSDRETPIKADGPVFDINEISPIKNVPYYKLAILLMKKHLAQGEVSQTAIDAEESGDYSGLIDWLNKFNLIFGKSHVPCLSGGDVFEGISDKSISFIPQSYSKTIAKTGTHLKLSGAFKFYEEFWKRHGIDHIANLVKPEVSIGAGELLHIPLEIVNNIPEKSTIEIKLIKPDTWEEWVGSGNYELAGHQTFPLQTFITIPWEDEGKSVDLVWKATVQDKAVGEIKVRVDVKEWTLPQ